MGRIVGNKRGDSDETKFWRLVRKTETCWEWIGGYYINGYGRFAPNNDRIGRASRFSWALHYGPITNGLLVLHHCDNRACVRPEHLFLGTYADNAADAVRKGRIRAGERHGQAKLTQRQVDEIRVLRRETNLSYEKIARRFGVSHTSILNICLYRRWTS